MKIAKTSENLQILSIHLIAKHLKSKFKQLLSINERFFF